MRRSFVLLAVAALSLAPPVGALAASPQETPPAPASSVKRIKARLQRNPSPPLKIDVRSITPVARFTTTVNSRAYVPTFEEWLRKEFALTALQRQSAEWGSRCCGINLQSLVKEVAKARREEASRKLREQIQRDIAANERALEQKRQ